MEIGTDEKGRLGITAADAERIQEKAEAGNTVDKASGSFDDGSAEVHSEGPVGVIDAVKTAWDDCSTEDKYEIAGEVVAITATVGSLAAKEGGTTKTVLTAAAVGGAMVATGARVVKVCNNPKKAAKVGALKAFAFVKRH